MPEEADGFTVELHLNGVPGRQVGELRLVGELDAFAASRFDAAVEDAAARGSLALVVDLGAVTFIDSSGLRSLVRARRRFDRPDAFVLHNPQPVAIRLLEITGLEAEFPIR